MARLLLVLAALIAATLLWFVADQGKQDDGAVERSDAVRREEGSRNDLAEPETHTARAPALETAATDVDAVLPALRAETIANANGMLVVVEDASGAPLPGALVKVWWRKGWGNYDAEEGVTDAKGILHTTVERLVEFEDIDVRTEAGGDVFTTSHGDITSDPLRPDRVLLRVPAMQRLSVRVEDLGGRPQPGVDIEYTQAAPLESSPFINVLARDKQPKSEPTGPDGVTGRDLELGTWNIRVRSGARVPLGDTTLTLEEADGERCVTLRVLSNEDGRPVQVDVQCSDSSRRIHVFATGTLDESAEDERLLVRAVKRWDDLYVVFLPRRGSWTVTASCIDFQRGEVSVPSTADAVTVVLEPNPVQPPRRRLTGHVISAVDGSPLRATLTFATSLSTQSASSGRRAGADGFFDLRWSRLSTFYVRATHRGHVDAFLGPFESTSTGAPIGTGPYEIKMKTSSRIAGRIVDADGVPVESWVYLHRSNDLVIPLDGPAVPGPLPDFDIRIGTGEAGWFQFDDVTDSAQRLWIVPDDASLPPALVDARGGDKEILVTIGDGLEGRGTLRGRVVDGFGGRATADIRVQLRPRTRESGAGTAGLSGADGSFAVVGVVPGRFDVVAGPRSGSGQHFAQRVIEDVEVLAGENTLDIVLLPARQLHVVVLDQGGEPLGGARLGAVDGVGLPVEFLDRSGNPDGSSVWTDAAGRGSMNGLPAGWVTLRVWRGEESMDAGVAPIGQVEIDLTLPVTQRVKVKTRSAVRDATLAPSNAANRDHQPEGGRR